ncbi:MAG: AraC family transcriptional regulator N-terminal domain-containing protein [Candidatus Competibacteraceae bacterium]
MNTDKPAEANEADRLEGGHFTLADRIARWTAGENRFDSPIQGLALHRWEMPTEPTSYMLPPSICLIGQGRKRLFLGEEAYVYDAHRFLMTSVDLPVVTQIIEASSDKPYLGLTLELDLRMVAQIMLASEMALTRPPTDRLGVAVSKVSPRLLDAFQRLIDLLEHPADISALAPLVQQEIIYHLLAGEQGPRLRQITSNGNHSYRIARAIDWLKGNFNQRLRVEDLANKAGLSTSAFHSHFAP